MSPAAAPKAGGKTGWQTGRKTKRQTDREADREHGPRFRKADRSDQTRPLTKQKQCSHMVAQSKHNKLNNPIQTATTATATTTSAYCA